MRYELSANVEGDLEAIADYIALDNPRHALSFIDEIEAKFNVLSLTPYAYRLRPEIGLDARMLPFKDYVILFRILASEIEVVRIERILHGGRDLIDLFSDQGA